MVNENYHGVNKILKCAANIIMEEEKQSDLMLEMEARMYAPLQWESLAPCKIQDLKAAQYEEALCLIKV